MSTRIKVNIDGAGPSIMDVLADGKYCKKNNSDPWVRNFCNGVVGIIRFDCQHFEVNGQFTPLKKTPWGALLRCKACLEAEMPEGLVYKKTKDDILFRGMWRSMTPTWPGWPIIAAREKEVKRYTPEDMVDAVTGEMCGQDVTLLALSLENKKETL